MGLYRDYNRFKGNIYRFLGIIMSNMADKGTNMGIIIGIIMRIGQLGSVQNVDDYFGDYTS